MLKRTILLAVVVLGLGIFVGPLGAAINYSGDLRPADPSAWDSSTYASIETGSVTVDGGSDLVSRQSWISYSSGSRGLVTIDGIGSTWTNSGRLSVRSNGVLNITNGGAVINGTGEIFNGEVAVDGIGSTWTNSDGLSVSTHGAVNITGGASVINTWGEINGSLNSPGKVTVDGAGSTWTNSRHLDIGSSDSGTLDITNGGHVIVAGNSHIARWGDSTGAINFGTNGGTLTTGTLFTLPEQLTGTGTVNTRGLVSDFDLVFDATHGASQTFSLEEPGKNITFNLDMSGDGNIPGYLGVGYRADGSVVIRDGVTVKTQWGYIGYKSGSTGEITVEGVGSRLAITAMEGGLDDCGGLYVGLNGSGTLTITDGGMVSAVGGLMVGRYSEGDSSINMATGGMLAIQGQNIFISSITDFFDRIGGTDDIRYWDGAAWAHISGATAGTDYTLEYLTEGELAGFTMLTVGVVPEPSAVVMILVGLASLFIVRRR
jgi:T5SS/PEP-CTERM-associated repeat protein